MEKDKAEVADIRAKCGLPPEGEEQPTPFNMPLVMARLRMTKDLTRKYVAKIMELSAAGPLKENEVEVMIRFCLLEYRLEISEPSERRDEVLSGIKGAAASGMAMFHLTRHNRHGDLEAKDVQGCQTGKESYDCPDGTHEVDVGHGHMAKLCDECFKLWEETYR